MPAAPVELLLIRHATADHGGRLVGRTDVAALLPGAADIAAARQAVGQCHRIVTSPALRCRMTAQALFPGVDASADPDLWEQDFGNHEGMAFSDLPDLGPLSRKDLARHRPPGGESFADLAARTVPALCRTADSARPGTRVAIVAHAGTVRAAIGMALGEPAQGLAFEIAPLSATLLTYHGETVSIAYTNLPLTGPA